MSLLANIFAGGAGEDGGAGLTPVPSPQGPATGESRLGAAPPRHRGQHRGR